MKLPTEYRAVARTRSFWPLRPQSACIGGRAPRRTVRSTARHQTSRPADVLRQGRSSSAAAIGGGDRGESHRSFMDRILYILVLSSTARSAV